MKIFVVLVAASLALSVSAQTASCKVPVVCGSGGSTTFEWQNWPPASSSADPVATNPTQPPVSPPDPNVPNTLEGQTIAQLRNAIALLSSPGWMNGLYGYQYYVSSGGTSVKNTDAMTLCQGRGARLATFGMRNATARTFIVDNILRRCSDTHGFWIGLKKFGTSWVWGDGVPATASNTDWGNNQPDGHNNANCGVVARYMGYKWDDVPCQGANNGVLCEKYIGGI